LIKATVTVVRGASWFEVNRPLFVRQFALILLIISTSYPQKWI